MDDLTELSARLDAARSAADVFGENPRATYRRLVRLLHPDVAVVNGDRAEAEELFKRVSSLWEVAQRAITDGTYGTDRMPLARPITVRTRRQAYTLTQRLARGSVADEYSASDAEGTSVSFRVSRHHRNNDLMAREAAALKALAEKGDDAYLPYFPTLIETCGYKEPGGVVRRANIVRRLTGFYTLEEVRAAYPAGVDPKDAAWMARRLFVALGAAHQAGVVHGAVVPSAVLIHPALHGLVLSDWFYSSVGAQPLAAVPSDYRAWYPDDTLAKKAATVALDLHLAGATLTYVMGGDAARGVQAGGVPRPLRAFLRSLRGMPDIDIDAWEVKENFDDLLERMWGRRRFRPFSMTTT